MLELHDSFHDVQFVQIITKIQAAFYIFLRLCILAWNCENSEYINNSFLHHKTIPVIYISVLLLLSQILPGLLFYREAFNAQNFTCGVFGRKLLLIHFSS